MTPEIITKLRPLLDKVKFTEESQVVYFLVEARKLLDRENNAKYPLLIFYRDWSVHTAKDRISSQIKKIMEDIHKEIIRRSAQPTFVDPTPILIPFVSMMPLRKEISDFLAEYGLPDGLLLAENWTAFQSLLASILVDQPIHNPCTGIGKFSFKPAAPGCVIVEIEYEKAPAVFDVFKLAGAF